MFRRTWWTRRRVVVSVALFALLAAVVWECGTEEVAKGQPLDEAKAALRRAGAVDKTEFCGMHTSIGGRNPPQVSCSMWELPDGRTVWLVGTRDSNDEPFRVFTFDMWQGWYKSDTAVELPHGDSVRFRRSVFAVIPH